MNYKYIGIASIISILMLYIYFKFSKDDNKSKTDEFDTKLLFEKIQKNDKVLKLLLSHTIRYLKRDKYSDKQLLDRLNKDSLFNKDYDTARIIIDSHSMKDKDITFNSSDFYYSFISNSINDVGGHGIYENVIGFRFIKGFVPNTGYVINASNNQILYNASHSSINGSLINTVNASITDTGNIETSNPIYITLQEGFYNIEDLPDSLPHNDPSERTTLNASLSPTSANISSASASIQNIDVTYNPTTHKFTFTCHDKNVQLKFFWDKIPQSRAAAKLFGFSLNGPSTQFYSTSHTSDKMPDLSMHYVDLIIDEIPLKACKHSGRGGHLIERLPLDVSISDYKMYEPYRNEYQNYFLPISLSGLNIKLITPSYHFSNNDIHQSQGGDLFLEFELTMIQNTKNVGLFN